MSNLSSPRIVRLLDARAPGRPFVAAELYRDYPAARLAAIESLWAEARGQVPHLEHAHWDWRNKADGVESGRYMLAAVECDGEPQGVMAVLRMPQPARLGGGRVVYVDYLEVAPWNLKGFTTGPRFVGVGTMLLVEAVRLSYDSGLGGRVGLHSLPQAEPFYVRSGMSRVGTDPGYYDLTYFEYTEQQAAGRWAAVEESS
jgi:hypothetical protein